VIYDAAEGFAERPGVKRIEQVRGVAGRFRKTGSISRDHGRAALNRLEHGQTKAFKVRWINETKRAAVKCRQIRFRNIADKLHAVVQTVLLCGMKNATIQPATFSGDDQLGRLIGRTRFAQALERLDKPGHVFSGLDAPK